MQEDVNAKPDLGAISTKETNSIYDLYCERVSIKLRRNKLISKKWYNNNTIKLQHSQPIAVVVIKYAILRDRYVDSLQKESEAFQKHRTGKVELFFNE